MGHIRIVVRRLAGWAACRYEPALARLVGVAIDLSSAVARQASRTTGAYRVPMRHWVALLLWSTVILRVLSA